VSDSGCCGGGHHWFFHGDRAWGWPHRPVVVGPTHHCCSPFLPLYLTLLLPVSTPQVVAHGGGWGCCVGGGSCPSCWLGVLSWCLRCEGGSSIDGGGGELAVIMRYSGDWWWSAAAVIIDYY
jgi:hypothetical protein